MVENTVHVYLGAGLRLQIDPDIYDWFSSRLIQQDSPGRSLGYDSWLVSDIELLYDIQCAADRNGLTLMRPYCYIRYSAII
jgi:hypothetical protein